MSDPTPSCTVTTCPKPGTLRCTDAHYLEPCPLRDYALSRVRAGGGDLPLNPLAERCLGWPVNGDVAVVRSSTIEVNHYEDAFSANDFMRTLAYHRADRPVNGMSDRQRRERERYAGKFGLDESFLPPGFP
ncbi:hypothetical protein BO86DRAFT_413852 [Aspergillus japonicus CBS 114.51]|uniref:Uncharacterized protein n=2 Tax=Aspergillus TaxID=5052 RepID=A0A2V5H6P5_ASPV1|nr:hypothetical protein BO86DRAFT_413852 [Aspergillus japonicus CBS 114.51]PYI19905.1 hypothetical protein BO99DRAFT_442793 [Aspergillus violaceofuscus CBS 115571]RAH76457.1 hypothetical protein BO86DRAFT_413852 [Aspergillus japonicus CBS 114.51]